MLSDDIKALLLMIKEDVAEIKPQVRCARDHVVELKTQTVSIHDRLVSLEKQSIDLLRTLPKLKTKIDTNECEVIEIKRSRSKIIYWALGLVVLLMSAVLGWVGTVSSMKADVAHIYSEQTKIRSVLKSYDKNSAVMKGQ